MANIKSSAKRVLVSRVRAERNKADKSELKTTIKKFDCSFIILFLFDSCADHPISSFNRSSFSCVVSLRKLTPMQETGTHISSRRS